MAFLRNIDVAALAVEGVSAAVGGGVQEYLWRPKFNPVIGYLATGAALLGGIFLGATTRGAMSQAGHALYNSGATFLGVEAARRFVQTGATARLPASAQNGITGRTYAPAFNTGRAHAHPPALVPASNRAPQVALLGVNSNTGEEIRVSRV